MKVVYTVFTTVSTVFTYEGVYTSGQGRSQTFDRGGGAKGGNRKFLILEKFAKI